MKHFFETIFGEAGKPNKEDKLFFTLTKNIVKKEDTKAGLINNLELAEGTSFVQILLKKEPQIVSLHQGIDKVEQDLKLSFSNPGAIFSELNSAKEKKITVSILHTDKAGNSFLYGENIGLTVTELTQDFLLLEGEEADTFYKVDDNLVKKLTI